MTNGIWIVGAGGHAKVAAAALLASGTDILGFLDDDQTLDGTHVLGKKVMLTPGEEWWQTERRAFIGIGRNATRQRLASDIKAHWCVARHPHSWCDPNVKVSEGVLICAGAVVQPDAEIGAHAILNTRCSVDHDCRIGDYAHIAPGATLAGAVRVGDGGFIGAGATVLPGIEIGAGAMVGAGAVVTKNVEAGATVIGIPAREARA